MPTRARALLPKTCIICAQPFAPHSSRQAREKTTCSPACAGRASGQHRVGLKQRQKSERAGRACTKCGHWQGWGQFAWTVRGVRRQAWCRSCVSAYNRAYRAAYGPALNRHKRARTKAGAPRWGNPVYARWRKTFLALERTGERARRAAALAGAYFRDYLRMCDDWEKPYVYGYARAILCWLYRSHCWMSDEQIAAAMRTHPAVVRARVAAVRKAIRKTAFDPLAAHAQELLRQCEQRPAPDECDPRIVEGYRARRRTQSERARRAPQG